MELEVAGTIVLRRASCFDDRLQRFVINQASLNKRIDQTHELEHDLITQGGLEDPADFFFAFNGPSVLKGSLGELEGSSVSYSLSSDLHLTQVLLGLPLMDLTFVSAESA